MKKNQKGFGIAEGFMILVVVVLLGAAGWYVMQKKRDDKRIAPTSSTQNYDPQINPSDFTTKITNPYFSLPIGKKMVSEAETAEGFQKVVIDITGRTKKIQGVETLIARDRVYQDGELIEETEDYLAQDNDGNVWHFGESGNNYEDGESRVQINVWLAGVDGAKAGIWIKAKHEVNDSYRQKFQKNKIEDMADVVAINQTVTTARATYHNCVKYYNWTPLDIKSREHKYYCREVGALVLTENLESGAREELINIIFP